MRVVDAGRFCLTSVTVPDAALMDALTLQRHTIAAYRALAAVWDKTRARHPVRFWNLIPDIAARCGEGLDRYRAFNAGRFAAFSEWYGGVDAFDGRVATATGVGFDGVDLVIHALSCETPGLHIQNPRQKQPYRYSRRYGPFPPCFARATIVPGEPGGETLLLIGGTASVCGEDSLHVGDLDAQLTETFDNMSRLMHVACERAGETKPPQERARLLNRFRDLRVYVVRGEDVPRVRETVVREMPGVAGVEYVCADICRAVLLVEIEGSAVANVDR